MHVKSLMIPFEDLQIIRTNHKIGEALELIKRSGLLSLPVVDEQDVFVGVLSKRYVYEEFFNNSDYDKNAFNDRPVNEFMKTRIPVTQDNIYVEEAALSLVERKFNFMPIVDEHTGRLKGIITSSKLLEAYKHFFGMTYPKLVIFVYDFKGKLAQIASIISKAGGNIHNIVQVNTDVMGLQEITIRVETQDIKPIVKSLKKQDIDVRDFTE